MQWATWKGRHNGLHPTLGLERLRHGFISGNSHLSLAAPLQFRALGKASTSATKPMAERALSQSLPHPIDYSGFGRPDLSSWSIGGQSPLLQRSQNFLLLIAAVELAALPSGPPSAPQAARVSTAATNITAQVDLEP